MIVRLHPNACRLCGTIPCDNKVINGTLYPDIQELYMAAAAVISDFSNTSFQFALLDKPAFLCALDYHEYVSMRGLTDSFDICPFPKSMTNAELIKDIESFKMDDYLENLHRFKEEVWKPFDDGHAAEKTVAWLKQKMEQK